MKPEIFHENRTNKSEKKLFKILFHIPALHDENAICKLTYIFCFFPSFTEEIKAKLIDLKSESTIYNTTSYK